MTAPTPKARKVFRNPSKYDEGLINTYRASRTLTINGKKRQPGELVPEAHTWLRVNNFTHTGYLEDVQVPEAEFDQAVGEHCPDLADSLAEKAKGIKDMSEDRDTKFTGFQVDENGRVQDRAAQRRLERERQLAETAPNDRAAADHSATTPQGLEENTPDDTHSDGGPTLWVEPEGGKGFDDVLERADEGEDKGDKARASKTDTAPSRHRGGDKPVGKAGK